MEIRYAATHVSHVPFIILLVVTQILDRVFEVARDTFFTILVIFYCLLKKPPFELQMVQQGMQAPERLYAHRPTS